MNASYCAHFAEFFPAAIKTQKQHRKTFLRLWLEEVLEGIAALLSANVSKVANTGLGSANKLVSDS